MPALVFQPELNSSQKDNRLSRSADDAANTDSNAKTLPTGPPSPSALPSNATVFQNKTSTAIVTPTKAANMTVPDIPSTANATASAATSTVDAGDNSAGTAVAVVITMILVALLLALVLYVMKRKGKLKKPAWLKISQRKRRSSTSSSRRALDFGEHEGPAIHDDDFDRNKPPNERDMFTIDDFGTGRLDEDEDPTAKTDEYFYDEVFVDSQFQDEATNNAVRHFSMGRETGGEEELLDFDFETLGINIDDYTPNSNLGNI